MKIIDDLKTLDLTKYPADEIKALIGQFGKFGLIENILHAGKKTIIRSRLCEPSGPFTTREEVSYKPSAFNKSYQRASTPDLTMFYGGILPEDIRHGELKHSRLIAAWEVSGLLRKDLDGEQKMNFSHWEVTGDIPLIALVYDPQFINRHRHTKELNDLFHKGLKNIPEDLKAHSIEVTTYLAAEFAKSGIEDGENHKYMISALVSELIVSKGKAGVYYPSIRCPFPGYNVAIAPEYVDKYMRLISSGECTIYKKGKNIIIDNETVCTITDDSKPFTVLPVEPGLHIGRDNALRDLDSKS